MGRDIWKCFAVAMFMRLLLYRFYFAFVRCIEIYSFLQCIYIYSIYMNIYLCIYIDVHIIQLIERRVVRCFFVDVDEC